MIQDLALYTIEVELSELLALREQAMEEGEPPEAFAAIDARIAEYCSAEVAKVDRIAGAIRACERNEAALDSEIVRLRERKHAWTERRCRIKDAALRAMEARGIKSLETSENRLTVAGNGGAAPLEFTGEPLPSEFCTYTVSMNGREWRFIMDLIDAPWWAAVVQGAKREPWDKGIRAALQHGETVPGARFKKRGSHLKLS
jgi:hypothetical protein